LGSDKDDHRVDHRNRPAARDWEREPDLDFQDYAQRELFDQLGIPTSAYFWQRDRSGTTTGYSQLFLRPLESGRLGELIVTGGVYDGKRVVSKKYMREFRTGGHP
jgi:CubicO group peptidase (beta-lactamase class C family)